MLAWNPTVSETAEAGRAKFDREKRNIPHGPRADEARRGGSGALQLELQLESESREKRRNQLNSRDRRQSSSTFPPRHFISLPLCMSALDDAFASSASVPPSIYSFCSFSGILSSFPGPLQPLRLHYIATTYSAVHETSHRSGLRLMTDLPSWPRRQIHGYGNGGKW